MQFRPEFINRIDDIVIFDRIKEEDMTHIVEVQLRSMLAVIEKSKDITLTFTKEAKDALAREGYDQAFGARQLKRVIQKRILNKLAREIIDGKVAENAVVEIGYADGDFVIESKPAG